MRCEADDLVEYARRLGLDPEDAAPTISPRRECAIASARDFRSGVRSGVNGTPTFFINGERHDGPFEFEDLVAALEAKLASRPAG